MEYRVYPTKAEMGAAAAQCAAELLHSAIAARGEANLVLATGASQFEMLDNLVAQALDWSRVTAFHLDEYIGLSADHPASFRRYLQERFVRKLPRLRRFHFVDGEADPPAECQRLGALIRQHPIDVACVGVGENGHLAFNDPPADFETAQPFLVVQLDEACRRQQMGEGWFPTLADVPAQAISMSIRQIMRSRAIVCTAPDARKAIAIQQTIEGPVTPLVPASILQQHANCQFFLDPPAAALLKRA